MATEKQKQYKREWRGKNKERLREYDKRYRKDHKKEGKEQKKQWYRDNKKRILQQQREYCIKNREHISSRGKRYREGHRIQDKERRKRWYRDNKGERDKKIGEWRKENPELWREIRRTNRRKYKIKKIGSVGSHTLEEWEALKKRCGFVCQICKRKEPFNNQHYKFLTEDHIIPLSKGGSDFIKNIQPLCSNCNSTKGAIEK